jgi:hypothetical protein
MDTSQREVNISIPFINKGSEIGPNLDGKQNKPNLLSRLFFWWVVPIIEVIYIQINLYLESQAEPFGS